jgi:hypothetical protein
MLYPSSCPGGHSSPQRSAAVAAPLRQGRVRSLRKGPDGQLSELLLRVEISGSGPVPQLLRECCPCVCNFQCCKPASCSFPAAKCSEPTSTPDFELDDQGYQLRRSQVASLGVPTCTACTMLHAQQAALPSTYCSSGPSSAHSTGRQPLAEAAGHH